MKIELSKAGKIKYLDKSLSWHLQGDDYATATIAGEEMTAYVQDGQVRLSYFGYQVTEFADMGEAMKAAPGFTSQVFDLLKQRVLDYPPVGAKKYETPRFENSSDCTP